MVGKNDKDRKICSFCGKKGDEQRKLIAGPAPGLFICAECVSNCQSVLNEDRHQDEKEGKKQDFQLDNIPTPQDLKEHLDDYVVGQDEAKKVLSVAVYNHYKRITSRAKIAQMANGVELEKANVLMIGPTGTGKTLLARTLAKRLNVPFAIADATTLTEAGYVGEDVENILLKLIQAADNDISKAEMGIIYVDEIDKIAKKGENVSLTRDVSGEGVQQGLLKIIEGTDANVPPQGGRKHPGQEMLKINTSNILFICSGAFVGLDKIITSRTAKGSIGFGATTSLADHDLSALYSQLQSDDLIKFGLIPEFIGRLPIHVALNNLDKEDLKHILTQPKNAILKQYQASLALDDADLAFETEAVDAIADEAILRKTGARGLRSIVEKAMTDLMFQIPSIKGPKKVIVTKKSIEANEKLVIITDSLEMNAPWPKPLYENKERTNED